MKLFLIGLIKLYKRTLSLWIGNSCRFYPSCSSYGMEAIEVHGSLKGSWLTLKRICKCHPLHPGGIDQVPGCSHTHSPNESCYSQKQHKHSI
ncbi:MAG: membrane protein insertion efficiency factor YidD [Kangiellaceae bacterium]|jgi:uncharacterized protein